MWSSIVGALLGKVAPKVADYYMQKEALKHEVIIKKLEGKIAWEEAKTRRAEASEGRDHEWEVLSIRNSGYKDEWVLFLLSIPLVMSFIPKLQVYVVEGFEALAGTPDWYRFLVLTVFGAIYGLRLWRRTA